MRSGWVLFAGLFLVAQQPLLAADDSVDDNHWASDYDHYFIKYTKRYFGPAFNWRWFKAQAIAESNLDPHTRSDAGALGLMQLLPTTYREIKESNPHFKSITDPEWNIAAGIYYDRTLYRKWRDPLPDQDRLMLSFASYNAGYVRIRRAYKRAETKEDNLESWQQVKDYVPGETRHYVHKIKALVEGQEDRNYRRLKGLEKYLAANNEDY